MSNTKVFLCVSIGGVDAGKLVIELYKDLPKTAENFRALCTGEKGMCQTDPTKPMHFKNSMFHRIIPGFMAQGGDITKNNGQGGESIYGPKFQDESFKHKHNGRGDLSMANSGSHTNGSQFFITFKKTDWLNNKHVVFGKVVQGIEVLDKIEAVGTSNGKPKKPVIIFNCGVL